MSAARRTPGRPVNSRRVAGPVVAGSLGEEGGAASKTPMPEDPSAQMAYRWTAKAHSLAWRRLGFLVLDAVVVVQQARLVGAGSAVPSVEQARWMVMVDQHGCSSRSTRRLSEGLVSGRWR